jgi:hypothetical protein
MKTNAMSTARKALVLAAVIATLTITVTAAEPLPPGSYNGLYHYITLGTNPSSAIPVLIGQDLWFLGTNNTSAVIQGNPGSDIAGEIFTADHLGRFESSVLTQTGIYYVNPTIQGSTVTAWEAQLAVAKPVMIIDLKVFGTSIASITRGTTLEIDFINSLAGSDMVSLVITDPDGNIITSTSPPTYPVTQYFDSINVSYLTSMYGVGAGIDTTNWQLGDYKFRVQTENDAVTGYGARGLEMSSNEKTLSDVLRPTPTPTPTPTLTPTSAPTSTPTTTPTPSPTPTPTPTLTPIPTPSPTPSPTPTPTPTLVPSATPTPSPISTSEEPGFESVYALAGLVAVVYLLLKRKS